MDCYWESYGILNICGEYNNSMREVVISCKFSGILLIVGEGQVL